MRAAAHEGARLCALRAGYRSARSFDGYAPTPASHSLSPFHGSVRALSRIRRTGPLYAEPRRRVRPIQMQLNSQFQPLRTSEKDYGRAELGPCVPHLHPCTEREREGGRDRERRMHKCIHVPPADVESRVRATDVACPPRVTRDGHGGIKAPVPV